MFIKCPECGQTIDIGPPAKIINRNNSVSLGCGTLILIAIIVAIFSGNDVSSGDIQALQSNIQSLETKIDNLEKNLRLPLANPVQDNQ